MRIFDNGISISVYEDYLSCSIMECKHALFVPTEITEPERFNECNLDCMTHDSVHEVDSPTPKCPLYRAAKTLQLLMIEEDASDDRVTYDI